MQRRLVKLEAENMRMKRSLKSLEDTVKALAQQLHLEEGGEREDKSM